MRKLKEDQSPPAPESSQHSVAELSRRLVGSIDQANKEAVVNSARAAVFESANAPIEKPMPGQMGQIVASLFDEDGTDFSAEKRDLEEKLRTSEKVGHQANALEQAEYNARRAMRLFLRYRSWRHDWEVDNQVLFASMRIEAAKALQQEKASGARSKQITDSDVETMCHNMFPDEMRVQEAKRNRAKLTERDLEHLVEVWSSKARSLSALVGKGR